MKKTLLYIAAGLDALLLVGLFFEAFSIHEHYVLEPATIVKVLPNPRWGFVGQDQMTVVKFRDGFVMNTGGNKGEPGDQIAVYRARGTDSLFGLLASH